MEIDCRLDELVAGWLREQAVADAQRAENEILGAVKVLQLYGCRSQWDWKQLTDRVLELEGKL